MSRILKVVGEDDALGTAPLRIRYREVAEDHANNQCRKRDGGYENRRLPHAPMIDLRAEECNRGCQVGPTR